MKLQEIEEWARGPLVVDRGYVYSLRYIELVEELDRIGPFPAGDDLVLKNLLYAELQEWQRRSPEAAAVEDPDLDEALESVWES